MKSKNENSLVHSDLKIFFWNSRSILNKKEEVSKIINMYDIFICVESWLKPETTNFCFPGYKSFRKD